MPSNEELYQQQLNEDRARQERLQAEDRARQAPGQGAGAPRQSTSGKPKISGIEFALMGLVAIGKDALDVIATVTIIGAIFTTILNVGATGILWLWCIFRLKKFPFKRFIGSGALEFIPGLDVLPAWTAFVLSLWLEQSGYIPGFMKNIAKKVSSPVPNQT